MRARFLVVSVALLLLGSTAGAAPVSWTLGPNFNGPGGFNAIDTGGRLIQAVNLTDANASFTVDPGGLNVTFTPQSSIFTGVNGFTNPGSPGSTDAAWNSIIGRAVRKGTGAVDHPIQITGLNEGVQYSVQLFVSDSRSFSAGESIFFKDGLGNDSPSILKGDFTSVIATFIADGSTQTLIIRDDDNPLINAFVVRQVPEPASLAVALVASLGALGWRRRRS